MKYRAEIDGIRAFAVLSVVVYHAFPGSLSGGFIGVDVFFVISGYLITQIILNEIRGDGFAVLDFYSRRIRRLFPSLIVVLLASFAIGWLVLLPKEFAQLGKHIAAGASFISNIILWNESGYFDVAAETKPLLHLWSLGIEEQFYIFWPIILIIGYRLKFNLLMLILIIGGLSFVANIYTVNSDQVAAFFLPNTRFWELLSGSILAWFVIFKAENAGQIKNAPTSLIDGLPYGALITNIMSASGISILVFAIFHISEDKIFPGYWALLPVFGTFLIIAAGSNTIFSRYLLANPLAVKIGLISYPLYLWHWPLLSYARIVEGSVPSWSIRTGAVVASIILAWLTYRFLERPMRYGTGIRKKVIGLVFSMILVGFSGCATYYYDGFGFRFPKMVRELIDFKYAYSLPYRQGTCFLNPQQTYDGFSKCKPVGKIGSRRLVLWGDSHAAHLFPGYLKYFGESYEIIQRTASACPPIINIDRQSRPNCKAINKFIFDRIVENPPDLLVLASVWNVSYDKLEETLVRLKNAGLKNIEIIGPVPRWKDNLPNIIIKSINNNVIPKRIKSGLQNSFINIDKNLRKISDKHGIKYISPYNILCNKDGCLALLNENINSITAWDRAHLTVSGSEYIVSKFPRVK